MLNGITDFIATYLDPISVVVGLLLSIPVLLTFWEIWFGRRRRERKWLRQIRSESGCRPAILIVDLLPGKDIRAAFEHFRQGDEGLRAIPDDRIIPVRRDERLDPDAMADLAHEIRDASAELIAAGADTIHFFYAGPAVVAAIVGAELANTARVLVYQHQPSGYRNFGPLRIEV